MRRGGAERATEVVHSRSGSDAAASGAAVLCTATSMRLPAQCRFLRPECVFRDVALRPGPSRAAAPVASS